jgi:hypothetical protein
MAYEAGAGDTMKYSLTAFPSLLVPVLVYAIAAIVAGGGDGFVVSLSDQALSMPMPSGISWRLSWGDLIVLLGLGTLFLDLLKATGVGTATVFNHGLSMAVFIICLILFLLFKSFGSSVFFILMTMALLDVIAGFTITIIAARRDVSFD